MSAIAVRDLDRPALLGGIEELTKVANREHRQVEGYVVGMLPHMIAAGEALNAIHEQIPYGGWSKWLAENFAASDHTAKIYMRFAKHRAALETAEVDKYGDAMQVIRQIAADERLSPDEEAERLERAWSSRREGQSYQAIGRSLGVNGTTVHRWLNPKYAAAQKRDRLRREKEARIALAKRRELAAARRIGGDVSEAYSLVRRALQAAEGARENQVQKPAARVALADAVSILHRAEDQIGQAIRAEATA